MTPTRKLGRERALGVFSRRLCQATLSSLLGAISFFPSACKRATPQSQAKETGTADGTYKGLRELQDQINTWFFTEDKPINLSERYLKGIDPSLLGTFAGEEGVRNINVAPLNTLLWKLLIAGFAKDLAAQCESYQDVGDVQDPEASSPAIDPKALRSHFDKNFEILFKDICQITRDPAQMTTKEAEGKLRAMFEYVMRDVFRSSKRRASEADRWVAFAAKSAQEAMDSEASRAGAEPTTSFQLRTVFSLFMGLLFHPDVLLK